MKVARRQKKKEMGGGGCADSGEVEMTSVCYIHM